VREYEVKGDHDLAAISFEKHLPRTFLELLDRHAEDAPFAVSLPAAVMMADVSGFSALAVELTRDGEQGVELLQGILDTYFGSLGAVIERFGGDISAFAGDAVIAVWPAGDDPGAAAAATAVAVQCALTIQAEAAGWSTGRPTGLTQRIAVAQGTVQVCKLGGAGGKWLHVFAGAPVLEAGRACDITTPGQVLVTAGVQALLVDRLHAESAAEGCRRALRLDMPTVGVDSIRGARAWRGFDAERLAPYVPDVLVRRAQAKQDEWLAEFRLVTVMFVKLDGAGFGREVDPSRLQAVTRIVQESVQRCGGALPYVQMDDKGLNFIVAWGIPTAAYEDDAARALIAGLEIQRSLRALGLRPALGVATGVLYCGECGAAQRRQYSMIGPAINFAARLAGAVPDDLLADEPTTKAAGDRLSFTIAQNVRPKHADATVLAFRPEPRQTPVADERVGHMVGRNAELAGMVGALQAAGGGAGVHLLLSGEPGIGKSRLLRELRLTIEAGGTRIVAGAAQSLERNTPYFLIREVFRALLAALARPGEPWRDTVSRYLQDDPPLLAWAPLLGDILPLALPESDLTREMRGTARAAAIQALLLRLVEHACADGPLVLMAEDLHWIDELSGGVLLMLAERAPGLSIVAVTRPLTEFANASAEEFCRHPALRRTDLGALDESQTAAIVGHLLGVEAVPDELSRLIHGRCEGNPFYIQQLTLALREGGHIELVGGRCLTKPDIASRVAQSLPGTLRGVITSRVDRLGDEQQLLLKVASVFGRVFSSTGLAAILPVALPIARVGELLAALMGSNLVSREGTAAPDEYAFSHALVQDAIYDLLPLAQRRRQHRRIADWLEEQHGKLMAGYFGLLANHCILAEEFPRAVSHLEGGARTAIRQAAYREAIQHLETAQRIATERQVAADALRRARWHSLLGDSRHELSELKLARREYLETLRLLGRPPEPGAAARAVGIVGMLVRQSMAGPLGLSGPQGAARPSEGAESARLASHAYAQLSEIAYYENDPVAVLHLTLRSAHEARRCASVPELSAAYGALAIAFGQMGLAGVARRHVKQAIALAESRPTEINGIAYAHLLAMVFASSQCDWAQLDGSAPVAESLYGELGERFRVAPVHVMRAVAATQRGRYADAEAVLAAAKAAAGPDTPPRIHGWRLAAALNLGAVRGRIEPADLAAAEQALAGSETPIDRLMVLGTLSSAWVRLGDQARALAAAREGLTLLLDRTPVAGAGFVYGPLGVVEALLACWDAVTPGEAREHAQQTARACAKLRTYVRQVPSTRARGLFLLGCHAERSGAPRRAIRLWRRAAEAAAATSMPYDEAVALQALGQRLPSGQRESQQAHRLFETLRVPPPALFSPGST
jgi:class 3 adenylate cyclase/tetratricopeptide (TPR) repeat protein